MPSPDQRRVKDIFGDASELPEAERAAYLDSACAADSELRAEVERLLAFHNPSDHTLFGSPSIGDFLAEGAEERRSLQPGDEVDKYTISRFLAAGGMGEVYEATNPMLSLPLALKTLKPHLVNDRSFVRWFHREIEIARNVTHRNVCRIFDCGEVHKHGNPLLYVTMELLLGDTLADRLKKERLSQPEALAMLLQITDGLRELHDCGVVHRDLKPGNIILVKERSGERSVITDFGLAQTVDAKPGMEVTAVGQLIGTPPYMSPEQLTQKPFGPEADIYALGVMMYQMLTGKLPFPSDNFGESAAMKLKDDPAPPGKLVPMSLRWERLILRCLERDPAKRPNIREVRTELAEIEAGAPDPVVPVPRPANLLLRVLSAIALTAILSVVLWGMYAEAMRPMRRTLCRAAGYSFLCDLPADKDMAIFPFATAGDTEADAMAAAGFARHLRGGLERLIPHPEKTCVHIRKDRIADGVALVVEGTVKRSRGTTKFSWTIREAMTESNRANALVLRRVEREFSDEELYEAPFNEFAASLGITLAGEDWANWRASRPKHAEFFKTYLEGLGYLDAGRPEAAASAFHAVLDPNIDFQFAPAQVGLGDAYRAMAKSKGPEGLRQSAQQAYQRAAGFDSFGFAQALARLGESEGDSGRQEQAADYFRRALALWPYDLNLRKRLAQIYETARFDDAEQVLREGTEVTPECWLAHNSLGGLYSRNGRFAKAERQLLEVIRLTPDNASAYGNLAFDYIRMGRYNDAIELMSKGLKLNSLPMSFSTLGRAYLYRGCSQDAMVNLQKAVDLQPNSYLSWLNLADGLAVLEPKSERARRSFERAAQLCAKVLDNPQTWDATVEGQRAVNLARLGKVDEAVRGAERAAGKHGSGTLLAIEAMEVLGKRDRALALLEEGLHGKLSREEVHHAFALRELRADPRYKALMARQGVWGEQPADEQSLTGQKACPNWTEPGRGFRAP